MAKFFEIGHEMANLATLLQRQVAKLASGLLHSWSLFRNNTTAINLQMFTSSYGSSVLPHVTRAPTEFFSSISVFF